MLRPTGTPEAFYVGGGLFHISKRLFKTEIRSARYFTLELGISVADQSEEYHFCEWLGVMEWEKEHLNRGRLPDASMQTFVQAIQDLE